MAKPGNAAIANANDNITAGTISLRNFITTPFEEGRARIDFRSSRSLPFSRTTSCCGPFAKPVDRERGICRLDKTLVAQLELERHGRNHVNRLAVHPDWLAAPLLYRSHRCI